MYYADADMPLKAARNAAIENARIQALASEFGTVISQQTDQHDYFENGQESNFFMQLNKSEVKGEWLEDTSVPECTFVEMLSDGMCVYRVSIKGLARAISNESVEFEALCLKNGTSKRFHDTVFREGDDLMYFTIILHENKIKSEYLLCCFRTTDIQKAFSFLFLERIWTIRVLKGTQV